MVLVLIVACFSSAFLPLSDITAEELIARHTEARGGINNLRAVKTSFERFVMNETIELTVWRVLPDKLRIMWSRNGVPEGMECYNGSIAWEYIPDNDNPDPCILSGVPAKALERAARRLDRLVFFREMGCSVSYLGIEEIPNGPAHVILLTMPDGQQEYNYLDVGSLMLVKTFSFVEIHGSVDRKPLTRILSEYRMQDGIMVPGRIVETAPGTTEVTVWLERRFNVAIDDAIFSLPERNPLTVPIR